MKVDDKVRLSAVGRVKYDDSERHPHSLQGTVAIVFHVDFGEGKPMSVIWDNDSPSFYYENELELVE